MQSIDQSIRFRLKLIKPHGENYSSVFTLRSPIVGICGLCAKYSEGIPKGALDPHLSSHPAD
jgi:hypothetical protein